MKTVITIDFMTNTTIKDKQYDEFGKMGGAGTTIGVCNAIEFNYF
jgi:hypothetical protein